MKHGRSLVMVLAVSMLAPLPLLAQGGGQGQTRPGMRGAMSARLLVDQGSVEYLVTKAADLGLTADQSNGLESIGAKWAASTQESRAQIRTLLPQRGQATGSDRDAMMQRMQQVRPLAEKLTADDQASLAEALKLLDETQQEKARALLE
ncbi:MAG: hypothetical protein ACRELT_15235, partial [Longimicrobiales bacterium]